MRVMFFYYSYNDIYLYLLGTSINKGKCVLLPHQSNRTDSLPVSAWDDNEVAG